MSKGRDIIHNPLLNESINSFFNEQTESLKPVFFVEKSGKITTKDFTKKNNFLKKINDENAIPVTLPVQEKLLSPLSKELAQNSLEDLLCSMEEIWQVRSASLSDKLASIHCSKAMLLPHQVEAATRVISSVNPRFLIADEVGLGKTIETGLIIKELILNFGYSRILICVPSSLLNQWQHEMEEKFNENFFILKGQDLKEANILKTHHKILVSIDLAKDPAYQKIFLSIPFDVVVFDEAHRLRRDHSKVTKAYAFAEKIAESAKTLLLLSATPFRGKLEELYYLIRLLDPDILGTYTTFERAMQNGCQLQEKLAPVVIRRRKVDVGGFTKRFARTVRLNLSKEEREIYNATTLYVKEEYNQAMIDGRRMHGFVMIVYQKLLDSSIAALLVALRRRRSRLESSFFQWNSQQSELELALSDVEDEEGILEDLNFSEDDSIDFDPKAVRKEILALSRIIRLSENLKFDSKLSKLLENIKKMQQSGHKKFLIFTQFRSTMEYLHAHLIQVGFDADVFHGGMSLKDKDLVVANFFGKTEVLILTEAGGEGRNLQIASALINYDLPWSPLKIEQRIGRIHRFGQEKDIHIINFACRDTVAERVLEVLETKIQLFEDALGESDVLIGVLENDLSFERNFTKFLNSKKSKAEWNKEIDKSIFLARKNLEKIQTLFSPSVLHFDLNAFRSLPGDQMEKIRQKNRQLEKTLQKALTNIKGGFRETPEGYTLDDRLFGFFSKNKNNGEYLSLGHKKVDFLISSLEEQLFGREYWLSKKFTQSLFFFEARFESDRLEKRWYTLFFDGSNVELVTESLLSKKLVPPKIVNQSIESQLLDPQNWPKIVWEKINTKVISDKKIMEQNLNQDIAWWQKNVTSSFHGENSELSEKLEIQRSKSLWYGERKMAGAIRRTIKRKSNSELRSRIKLQKLAFRGKIKISLIPRFAIHLELNH